MNRTSFLPPSLPGGPLGLFPLFPSLHLQGLLCSSSIPSLLLIDCQTPHFLLHLDEFWRSLRVDECLATTRAVARVGYVNFRQRKTRNPVLCFCQSRHNRVGRGLILIPVRDLICQWRLSCVFRLEEYYRVVLLGFLGYCITISGEWCSGQMSENSRQRKEQTSLTASAPRRTIEHYATRDSTSTLASRAMLASPQSWACQTTISPSVSS